MGHCNISELKAFQKKLERMNESGLDAFCQKCAKELTARLLAKAIARTPVEKGTLRRGWTGGVDQNAADYANSLTIACNGNTYSVEVTNPVEYAPYVEFGHRQTPGRYVPAIGKMLKAGWVNGKFMLTTSQQELESITPKLIEKRLQALLKEAFS